MDTYSAKILQQFHNGKDIKQISTIKLCVRGI